MSGMQPWSTLRALRQEQDDLAPVGRETIRRVLGFALPHRALIAGFLVFVVLDAALVVANPLLVKHLLDDGILARDTSVVVWLALAMAGFSARVTWYIRSVVAIASGTVPPTNRTIAGAAAIGGQAEIIGGIVLIVIAAKVLIDHRAFG